jgi:hypothetical protein
VHSQAGDTKGSPGRVRGQSTLQGQQMLIDMHQKRQQRRKGQERQEKAGLWGQYTAREEAGTRQLQCPHMGRVGDAIPGSRGHKHKHNVCSNKHSPAQRHSTRDAQCSTRIKQKVKPVSARKQDMLDMPPPLQDGQVL